MANIIPVSFKENFEDKLLFDWLSEKFNEYGNKSNYIKYVLRKEMKRELLKNQKNLPK